MGYFSWKTHDSNESIYNHLASRFEEQGQVALRLPDMALLPLLVNQASSNDLQSFANGLAETLVMRYDGHHNALIESDYQGYGVFGGLDAHGVRAILNAPFLLGKGESDANPVAALPEALASVQQRYGKALDKLVGQAIFVNADTTKLDELLAEITNDQALRCASIYQSQTPDMPYGLQFTFQEPPSAFQPDAAMSEDCPNQGYFEFDLDNDDDYTP